MESYKDLQQLNKDFRNPQRRKWIIGSVFVTIVILFSKSLFEQTAQFVWHKLFVGQPDSVAQKLPTYDQSQRLEINNSPGAIVNQSREASSSINDFKKAALKNLAQNAMDIYGLCKTLTTLLEMHNRASLPQEVPLTEWEDIKKNGDFIYLKSDKGFDSIIGMFRDYEKLNDQIRRAKEGDPAAMAMSWALYDTLVFQEKAHVNLLKLFKEDDQVKEFIKIYNIDLQEKGTVS